MGTAVRFEDVDVGYELRPLHLTLTPEQVWRYAQAARMAGERFRSDDGARKEGLPGQIVPGNLTLALFSRLIAESLPGASLKRLSATFRGMVRPGHALVLRGVLTEKHRTEHGTIIECDLVLENAQGDRWATGTAAVGLAPTPGTG